HAASVRPEPGSNSHLEFDRSTPLILLSSSTFCSRVVRVYCLVASSCKEAPDTLVRLLALFSFQRSTACCRNNFYILSIRQVFVNIFLQVS
ncbi:hypothetical protein, partial [Tetragenococcus halophilus]